MKTATFMGPVGVNTNYLRVNSAWFELSEPFLGHGNVVVSITEGKFTGPDTTIYAATNKGVERGDVPLLERTGGMVAHQDMLATVGYKTISKTERAML